MAYEEPNLPVAGNPTSVSGFGAPVRNSLIWLKTAVDGALSVSARKGGSATDWTVLGDTTYTSPKAAIQLCNGYVEFDNSSDLEASKTVTYPVAFSGTPVAFPKIRLSVASGMTIESTGESASGCTITIRKSSGSGVLSYGFELLAIGPVA